MRSLSSSRTLMTLPDIMQRAETNRKSGTLTRKHDSTIKIFYVQEGKIVFISSQKAGEQLGDFFSNEGGIDLVQVPTGFWESQRLGVPFTGYLISHCIIGKIALQKADPDACRNGIYGGH